MDAEDCVPLVLGHVHEHAIACNACVVDEDVETSERLDRIGDHALGGGEVGDVFMAHSGFAAGRGDLVGDLLRRRVVVTLARQRDAEVVDDDLRARSRKCERVLAADPATGAGDDRNLSVQGRHCGTFVPCMWRQRQSCTSRNTATGTRCC